VIIVAIILPFTLIAGIILGLLFKINISVERDITKDTKLLNP